MKIIFYLLLLSSFLFSKTKERLLLLPAYCEFVELDELKTLMTKYMLELEKHYFGEIIMPVALQYQCDNKTKAIKLSSSLKTNKVIYTVIGRFERKWICWFDDVG